MAIGDFCTNNTDCGLGEFCDNAGFCQASFGDSPPPPPSGTSGNCWKLTNRTIFYSADVTYRNTSGINTTVTLASGEVKNICSLNIPAVLPNPFGPFVTLDVLVENLNTRCTSDAACGAPPPPPTPPPTSGTGNCYTITNGNTFEDVYVNYTEVGKTGTSAKIILRGTTTTVCSTTRPAPLVTLNETVAANIIVSATGTTCQSDSTCSPSPPPPSDIPCKLYKATAIRQSNLNSTVLNISYTKCEDNSAQTQNFTLVETQKLTGPLTGSSNYTTPICSKTQPVINNGTILDVIVFEKDNPTNAECTPPPPPTPPPSAGTTIYTTTLSARPTAGGTVSGFSKNGTTPQTTPGDRAILFSSGSEQVQFSARENTGYKFVGWYNNVGLWSTNRDPGTIPDSNITYEARFEPAGSPTTCTCYFVAPTVENQSFQVTYQKCQTGEIVTETFSTFRNICSANIPDAGTNAQVPQNLGTDCSKDSSICGSPPPPPPPGPPPPPPPGIITFQPTLNEALQFIYTRGSTYPSAVRIRAINTSSTYQFSVKLTADTNFIFTPSSFTVPSSGFVEFTAMPSATLLNALQDGRSELPLTVEITRI